MLHQVSQPPPSYTTTDELGSSILLFLYSAYISKALKSRCVSISDVYCVLCRVSSLRQTTKISISKTTKHA